MRRMLRYFPQALLVSTFFFGAAQVTPADPALQNMIAGTLTERSPDSFRQVEIADVRHLRDAQRRRLDQAVAATSPEKMTRLRRAIDLTPPLSSALETFGVTSAQVVAVDIDTQGVLTLFVAA